MKIDILSDLHIDFYFNPKLKIKDEQIKKLYDPIINENNREIGDVLVVAGDIGHYNHQNIRILKYLKEHYYKHIICVLGNHDYYLVDKDSKLQFKDSFARAEDMRLKINNEENLYYLDGNVIEIDGIKFGGCDSWYNEGYLKRKYPERIFLEEFINKNWNSFMNDAKYILGINKFDDIWHIEKSKIEDVYEQCDVMITHISPSCKDEHFSPRFQNSFSNTFFSFEGEKYLKDGYMKYWIFGHTHEEIEYEDHGVNCLCNPFGYPSESGNGQWVKMKQIEV
jgi:predicted phosphodiesterase